MNYLEFEKPLAEIEGKAEELRALARANKEMDVDGYMPLRPRFCNSARFVRGGQGIVFA